MTKEEVIKAAYGEHWESFSNEVKKCALNNDGYIYNSILEPKDLSLETHQYILGFKWRPISLSGIENNNGWIKIEMESDMPKQRGTDDIYIIDELGEVQVASSKLLNDRQIFNYWKATITHYQPINKPKPPLF
jgi:hypothetical protein